MRSSDLRRTLRGRRSLALLVGATSLLGLGANPPAIAQGAPTPAATGEDLFGTYALEARGLGVQATYAIDGLTPVIGPVLDLTLPETLARFASGPSGYGLASLAYPGGIIANFPSLVAQSGGPGDQVPPYPIKAEAFYPSGPTEVDSAQAGGTQRVVTTATGVQSVAAFPSLDASPIVSIGSISSASRGAIEGDLAISRVRVVLGNVNILGGLITIDSLVTDLVAAHGDTTGSTAGGTTASGVKFLGLDASLTEKGLILKPAPAPTGPAAPFGSPLGALAEPLNAITGPVQDQLKAVLGQAVPQLNTILAQAGIRVALLDPNDQQVLSGAASRISTGLSLTFSYKGKEQQALVDLVNAIPPDLKPNVGPIPNPVTFLAENHIMGLALAPASVSSLATPPFPDFQLPAFDLPSDFVPGSPAWTSTVDAPGFATSPAPLPTPRATAGNRTAPRTEPVSSLAAAGIPAILMALALLLSPLFATGSSRLADTVLAGTSTSCPTGLDKPPAPPRPS